jgi:hypothetical protein
MYNKQGCHIGIIVVCLIESHGDFFALHVHPLLPTSMAFV